MLLPEKNGKKEFVLASYYAKSTWNGLSAMQRERERERERELFPPTIIFLWNKKLKLIMLPMYLVLLQISQLHVLLIQYLPPTVLVLLLIFPSTPRWWQNEPMRLCDWLLLRLWEMFGSLTPVREVKFQSPVSKPSCDCSRDSSFDIATAFARPSFTWI